MGHRVFYEPVVYHSMHKIFNQTGSGPFSNIVFVYHESHRPFECQDISKDTIDGAENTVRKKNSHFLSGKVSKKGHILFIEA